MTERQRGIIDCLEMCPNEEEVRIIDYKARPHKNDKLSLIFYVNLFNEFRIENRELDLFPYEVAEIGCYYYELGKEGIFKLEHKEMEDFKNSFSLVLQEISLEKFIFLSKCNNCIYFDFCLIEKSL